MSSLLSALSSLCAPRSSRPLSDLLPLSTHICTSNNAGKLYRFRAAHLWRLDEGTDEYSTSLKYLSFDSHAGAQARRLLRSCTRSTLYRRWSPLECMSTHPEGKTCSDPFECFFSMTLHEMYCEQALERRSISSSTSVCLNGHSHSR